MMFIGYSIKLLGIDIVGTDNVSTYNVMTILTLYVVNFECDFHYFHKSHTPKGSHYIVSTDNVATY
jgi:hypothetical protein